MPAARPCAAFEPISPDLDLAALVEATPNFEYVTRIHCDMIDQQGIQSFEKLVLLHVVLGGKPLVVEGYQERLEQWTFAVQWLKDNCASKVERARDLTKKSDLPLSIGHYLNNMAKLTDQWTARNYKEPHRQRMYLKDIDCPQVWHDKLKEVIPPGLFYLNDSTGDIGGPGSIMEPDPLGHGMRKGKGIAKAGDLMSCLPVEMKAENMMCYIGHEGTYTPAHREMCASLGQNIMVETSTGVIENGKYTKPGSSIWFMTETKDRHLVSEYWLSTLGHDIEIENHYAQINAWKAAPFKTYVVEQKVGDFILIPPLAPHQVWNRGTRTMKVAWNRTTVETLETALSEALPRARMVCRDEQYKNKAMIYYALSKYSTLLKSVESQKKKMGRGEASYPLEKVRQIRQLQKDFRRLFTLYTRILLSESLSTDHPEGKRMQFLPFESIVTCAYCRCNIFNRFLTCPSCISELPNGEEDTYDVCMECYAMGRSCACISKLKWVEQFPWDDLVQKHDTWRHQIITFEGHINDKSPQALYIERENLGKKTLAQICQEELKRRPWNDITQPPKKDNEEEEVVDVDDEGRVRKKRKIRRSEKWQKEHGNCHICRGPDLKWKLASCSQCSNSYCYGSLFRGFDMMPQTVMEDLSWKCPKCLMICSCSTCRKDPAIRPFEPTGTLLGHDTSKVADPRSVESLVNFSVSNVTWLKKAGDDHPHDTRRLRRRQEEAEQAKSKDPLLGDDYVEHDAPVEARLAAAMRKEFPLDPLLGSEYGAAAHDSLDETPFEYDSQDQPQFVASDQLMYGQDFSEHFQHGYAEGITYVYPDPEHPQYIRRPSPQPKPEAVPQNEDTILVISKGVRKRKKQNGNTLAQPDSLDGSLDPSVASKQQRQAPLLKKATNDNVNAVQSLVLKLAIDKSKLAELDAGHSKEGPSEPIEIIQSDLKPVDETSQVLLPQVLRTKVRLERDDEFKPRKDRKDKRKSAREQSSRTSTTYIDALELSDYDGLTAPPIPSYSSIRNHDRSDSKWLRMRKGSDDETSPTLSPTFGVSRNASMETVPNQQPLEAQPKSDLPTRRTTQDVQNLAQQALMKARPDNASPGNQETSLPKPSVPKTSVTAIPERNDEAIAKQIAENRRAKMDALRWAENIQKNLDEDASSESDGTLANATPKTPGHLRATSSQSRVSPKTSANGQSHPRQVTWSGQASTTAHVGGVPPTGNMTPPPHKPQIKNAIRPSRGRGGSSIGGGMSRASLNGGRLS